MSEPATTTSGVAIGAGVITLTGSVLGLQWDALLLGLFGGLLSLQHLPPLPSKWHVASTLLASALLAAALSPFAGAFLQEYFKWATAVPPEAPRLAFAVIIGIGAQAIVPYLLNKLRQRAQV